MDINRTLISVLTINVPFSEDTTILAKALLDVNKKLTVDEAWSIVNYQSTDVMGDSRNLIAVPLLASLGLKVPSIQGTLCNS